MIRTYIHNTYTHYYYILYHTTILYYCIHIPYHTTILYTIHY